MDIVIIILLIIGITFSMAAYSAAPWVPMRQADVVRVVKILETKNKGNFIELGSGDGRLLQAMAKIGWKAVGYEISVLPLVLSWFRLLVSRQKFTVKVKNFWTAPIGEADVIFTFLIPRILEKFKNKVETETKPGTIIISYVWPIPGWEPMCVDQVPKASKIFVYERK